MNGSVTIRLAGLIVTGENESGSRFPAASASGSEISDEALLVNVCAGDREALASLFRRYARLVRGIAYRVLRDGAEADDLLQDVFLFIPQVSGTFDAKKGPARSWLLQITYRRALNRRRNLCARHFYDRVDLDEVADDLADERAKAANEPSLDAMFGTGTEQELMAALSLNQRQTLRLFFMEGYTFEEIAVKLGQSVGNVRHHYFRGLERLRKALASKRQR